jgi:phosphatidylglycerophosphatase A
MGAVVGGGLYWLLSPLPHYIYIPTTVAFIFFAVWVSARACVIFGEEDPSKVTIDEIAGILVTFALHSFSWIALVVGFVLFRIFDIAKPFPVRWAERKFPGGWGVVMDDVVAGIYANIALWIIIMIIGAI